MAFNYSPKIVTDGLVLYFDAANNKSYPGSGTTWSDISRGGNNGTLVNGPTYNSANGGSIVFDGVDDRISTNYSPTSYTNTTQIIWYKWDGVNQLKVLYYFGNSSSNGFGLILNDGSNGGNVGNRISVLYGGSYYNALNTGSLYAQLVSNQWCQLALTRDSSTTILYQNGNIIGSTSRTPNTAASYNFSYGDITVGAAGNVSNMQFYIRVLPATEIQQNYNATKTRFGLI
jgi:hypothetical protein